jgi:CheY-like chemotaxis protein
MPKILVVDDEAEVRNVVVAILKQAGYDVVVAEYGLSGYSKAQSEDPDLVLLDLMMPVVDGFEVLGRLKENPSTSSIPVIILTAKIDAASERACMQLGAADYIKKPWGPHELQDRIGMALGYPNLSEPPQTGDEEPRTDGEPDNSEGPDEDQPPESPGQESPGAHPEYLENPALARAQRFHIRRFSAQRYLEDDPPEKPGAPQPPADGEEKPKGPDESQSPVDAAEDPESQGSVEYGKKFRTRRFRVRNDGIDPASLV